MCIYIDGDWQAGSKIQISGRLRDHPSNIGHDQLAKCLRFTQAGTTLDCALRICDSLKCAWQQQLGINVICEATQTPDGRVKITLRFPNGNIGWGEHHHLRHRSSSSAAGHCRRPTPHWTRWRPSYDHRHGLRQ